jgi:chemotaxis protein MotB
MLAQHRRQRHNVDIWPGFVDGLTTLLLAVIFVLVVFILAQFQLGQMLSGKDETLDRLNRQLAELSQMLSLERRAGADLRLSVQQLSTELAASTSARDRLSLRVSELEGERARLEDSLKLSQVDRQTVEMRLREYASLQADIQALRRVRAELEARIEAAGRESTALRDRTRELEARLASEQERTALAQKEIAAREIRLAELQALYLAHEKSLAEERQLSRGAQDQVASLNRQIAALRDQLAIVQRALELSETKSKEQDVQISDLGRRLNLALAAKVEELARYRSEFFGRLRQVLGERPDVRIVGDRFVFQSEVLFETASAEVGVEGRNQLSKLADALVEISSRIPPELNWVLQIEGHTDQRPISTVQFPSNWELSTARAISVVRFLVARGIPAIRVSAAGFGEFHPIDDRNDEIAFRRNRRIELKLTQR